MKRKKKKSLKIKPAGAFTKEQERTAASLLSKMNDSSPGDIVHLTPDAGTAVAFIRLLPLQNKSVPVLAGLKEAFKDKQVLKAIKQILFKLNNEGVATNGFFEEENEPSTILRALPKEEPKCLVGPTDGFGNRSFALILQRAMQGVEMAFGLVSEEQGIQQMMIVPVSKKAAEQMLKEFSQMSGPMVETSLSHAATILEQAHGKNQELKTDGTESYLELRPWLLKNCSFLDHPAIFDCISEASVQDQPLAASEVDHLLKQEIMFSWIIDYEKLEPFMVEMANMNDSPIILTAIQKANRVTEIREKCGRTAFPPEKAGLVKQNLEEMAYFFFKQDDEKNAITCLKAAGNFTDRDSLLTESLFIKRLVEKSIAIYHSTVEEGFAEEESEEETGSPQIWNP